MRLPTYSLIAALLVSVPAAADPGETPRASETIEVTATKIAEDVSLVPASVTVIDGDDLRARGATDLASALGTASGLSVAPGGDAGPAGSVPELWGLREFDAFLLVVDGIPWGGAFNPDLATIDLTGIDRVEVLRGAAPVMYGATSFVGVIHVIHRVPGSGFPAGRVSAGSFGSFSAAAEAALPSSSAAGQSLVAGFERKGFRPDRSGYDRAHLLYRAFRDTSAGALRLDFDFVDLDQEPYSPHPREGRELSADVPLDANHNPLGAKIDQRRLHAVVGLASQVGPSPWTTTLAVTRSDFDILRGFLGEESQDSNASGFTQDRGVTDVYFDSHVVRQLTNLRVIAGADYLYGRARSDSGLFDYSIDLAGENPPAIGEPDEETRVEDRRAFSSLYGVAEWTPAPAIRVDLGMRLNHTSEERSASEGEGEAEHDEKTATRPSGTAGITWLARPEGALSLFVDYRNAFKPAAIDFGPEAEGEILEPETSESWEAGAKGRLLGGRLKWQASAFQMDFENLVVSTVVDGRPGLENAGSERFRGAEAELDWAVRPSLRWEIGASYHDARFQDYLRLFDGVPTQLAGKRLEMSPFHLAGTALTWAPSRGLGASILVNYVGERYLDKRNRALADAYVTWSAGLAWRMARGEIRIDGTNLNNTRPPVAESELGDAQYYRLPARMVEVSWRVRM